MSIFPDILSEMAVLLLLAAGVGALGVRLHQQPLIVAFRVPRRRLVLSAQRYVRQRPRKTLGLKTREVLMQKSQGGKGRLTGTHFRVESAS